jgi:hypothetical protein
MKPSAENIRLAKEIHCRLDLLRVPSTAVVRAIRREVLLSNREYGT